MNIKGIITAMVTPMNDNEAINYSGAEDLINLLISKGVDGLFILGTNGEFHVLSNEEKIDFAEFVVKTVNHRVPVFVGTGGNRTKDVISLSRRMESLGADALSIINPYFLAISPEELVQYYESIASSVNIPIILYNIPKSTGLNIDGKIVARLSKMGNIVGIKDSSGNIENLRTYIECTKGQNFSVLVGSDSKILTALKLGARGAIAATSNVITENDVKIYELFKNGKLEEAEKYQRNIDVFRKVLHKASVPAVLKEALNLMGIAAGPARLPVSRCNAELVAEIKTCLEYFHIQHE
jgi:4-hydroxy-tetrahydrodipicolinate synthase